MRGNAAGWVRAEIKSPESGVTRVERRGRILRVKVIRLCGGLWQLLVRQAGGWRTWSSGSKSCSRPVQLHHGVRCDDPSPIRPSAFNLTTRHRVLQRMYAERGLPLWASLRGRGAYLFTCMHRWKAQGR